MTDKSRKRYKKIIFTVLIFFLFINLVLINQAYHLTHFFEQGTVKPMEDQTNGFWGGVKVVLLGLKQQKIIGTIPDSAFSDIKLKTKDSLILDAS